MVRDSCPSDFDVLVTRVAATSGLTPGVARRVVEDVFAHQSERLESYVQRRHQALAAAGWKNEAIYQQLADEVEVRLFAGPRLSVRQIRRIIYG